LSQPVAFGEYNELVYRVYVWENGSLLDLHEAGNAPFDSQGYLPMSDGVGLRKMRAYCIRTTRDMAKEHHSAYGGVERRPVEQDEGENISIA